MEVSLLGQTRRLNDLVDAKGITEFLDLSLTVRNEWREGRVERTNGQWGPWSAILVMRIRS